jgi:hypothetical protein
MPVLTEAIGAIARAEFPEGRVPRCAVAFASAGAGGNQPALHDILQKAILEKALAVDAREFLGLEYAPTVLLEVAQRRQGRCELFIGGCHEGLPSSL